MSKKIKIVWVNIFEKFESDDYDGSYHYNIARVSDTFLIDWEEVSDEDYQELISNWNTIEREFVRSKEYRDKHLMLLISDESNPVTTFDSLKAMNAFFDKQKRENAKRAAEEKKKKAEAKAKRDAKKAEKERKEFERLQKIFNSEKV